MHPNMSDTLSHGSIQQWSAGPLFPAVIALVERYGPPVMNEGYYGLSPVSRRLSISYELTIGAYCAEYATREDAETVARWACADGRIIPERYAELMGKHTRAATWHEDHAAGRVHVFGAPRPQLARTDWRGKR